MKKILVMARKEFLKKMKSVGWDLKAEDIKALTIESIKEDGGGNIVLFFRESPVSYLQGYSKFKGLSFDEYKKSFKVGDIIYVDDFEFDHHEYRAANDKGGATWSDGVIIYPSDYMSIVAAGD